MELFTGTWWQELLVQLVIAILTTVVGMLTYESRIAAPRDQQRQEEIESLTRRTDHTL